MTLTTHPEGLVACTCERGKGRRTCVFDQTRVQAHEAMNSQMHDEDSFLSQHHVDLIVTEKSDHLYPLEKYADCRKKKKNKVTKENETTSPLDDGRAVAVTRGGAVVSTRDPMAAGGGAGKFSRGKFSRGKFSRGKIANWESTMASSSLNTSASA